MRSMVLAVTAAGCSAVTSIQVAAPAAVTATEVAPPFELASHQGGRVRLADALATGDVVLVFYRGHW
ncbi:MAG: hypothetical protein JWP01_1203 [Myxococcales bacterium]|jgi:hypothetical protein|nr:hypothetical protein [Myxococcales bacterium]